MAVEQQVLTNEAAQLRVIAGLPVQQIASRVGVSRNAYYKWLRGGAITDKHHVQLLELLASYRVTGGKIREVKPKKKQTIAIAGLMLRAQGNNAIVELEINGTWHKIVACDMRGSLSHIVEPLGIQQCIETGKHCSS
jgi:transcriptional regulator with XRE-family HTH domain